MSEEIINDSLNIGEISIRDFLINVFGCPENETFPGLQEKDLELGIYDAADDVYNAFVDNVNRLVKERDNRKFLSKKGKIFLLQYLFANLRATRATDEEIFEEEEDSSNEDRYTPSDDEKENSEDDSDDEDYVPSEEEASSEDYSDEEEEE